VGSAGISPERRLPAREEPDEDPAEWADPADVTEVFVYLASDASRPVNGRRFQAQEENFGLAVEATA